MRDRTGWAFIHAEKASVAPVLVDNRFIFYDRDGLDWTHRDTQAAALAFFKINPQRHFSFS
jgi:hypothetical protein